jgi:hypothetical protein
MDPRGQGVGPTKDIYIIMKRMTVTKHLISATDISRVHGRTVNCCKMALKWVILTTVLFLYISFSWGLIHTHTYILVDTYKMIQE